MPKLIVIDDNDDSRDIFQTVFSTYGVDVDVASNGQIGVSLAMKNPYDLVVLDLNMEGMDGLDCARQLIASGYKRDNLVLATATDTHTLREYAQREKVELSDYFKEILRKPVELADLKRLADYTKS